MQSAWRERPTHVLVNKQFEPISQSARLRRNGVELAGDSPPPEIFQHVVGYQCGLPKPREKVFPQISHSTLASTGTAIVFKKSSPGLSAMKNGGGRVAVMG